MKILMVSPYFYPKIGGMENYAYNISRGLREKYGWDVVVVTSNHEKKKYKTEIINGLKIYRLPTWFKISNTPINPLWLFNIYKIIREEKPDVINVHSPVTYISDVTSLVAGKIPFITTFHSGSMIKEKSILNYLIFLYESSLLKLLFRRSTRIICYSPDYIKRTLSTYKTKVKYIPPGVDINIFKPSRRKVRNDILYVGKIDKSSDWKGINYLLDAIAIVKETKPLISLRLVGLGDKIEYFKAYANRLGISNNVKFVGPIVGKELAREYQNSHIFVLPSVTESESFGIVLIEAMACKKSVIGSKIGGIQYVIDNETNGLLVEPKNSTQIGKAIIKLLNNPRYANKLGSNGYKKVIENFNWNKQIAKTNKLLQSL